MIGVLAGCLIGGGLAAGRLSLETLTLWSKYQVARAAAMIGLSSMRITWPDERGEADVTVEDLLKTPGLDAWAAPVSKELVGAVPMALFGGLLAFAGTLLRSAARAAPVRTVARSPEQVSADPRSPARTAQGQGPHSPSPPRPPRPASIAPPCPTLQDWSPAPNMGPTSPNPAGEDPARSLPTHPPAAHFAATPPPTPPPVRKPGMSYESYWGLAELPFENVSNPKFYFPAPMHEEALHRLLYGVQTRKGAVMLTGEIGCGKTLLSRELSRHLSGQQYDVAVIANPSFNVEDFLTEVLYQLGIQPTDTKVRSLHLLNERLLGNYKRGQHTVVVIDEAQTIPDDRIFEELRLLLNFQLNDRFLLTLILIGQPELNDRVIGLKQFAQRISIKYHLGSFSAQQTADYVRFRLKAARCTREIFREDALDLIFTQSGGVPRNINTLCDLCLLIGFMDRAAVIGRTVVERAAAERGQLGLF
jgi:general secretion pathway protein A